MTKIDPNKPILYFDGVCVLCNKTVDILLKIDSRHALRFAALQGETAVEKLDSEIRERMDSMVLVEDECAFYKSEAVLKTLFHLGGIWPLMGRLGMLIPEIVRDGIYNWVAKNRIRIFGSRKQCRVPTEQDKHQLLP